MEDLEGQTTATVRKHIMCSPVAAFEQPDARELHSKVDQKMITIDCYSWESTFSAHVVEWEKSMS